MPRQDMKNTAQTNPTTMPSHQNPARPFILYPLQISTVLFTFPLATGYDFPKMAKKLFLLLIFCTFFAFLSNGLNSVGMGGIAGLSSDGLSIPSPDREPVSSRSGSSFGLCCVLRVRVLVLAFRKWLSTGLSSLEVLLRFSISPSIVVPLVARNSSAMPTKRTTPRSGDTPRQSDMKFWISAALRLLVVGWIWDGRAVRVKM